MKSRYFGGKYEDGKTCLCVMALIFFNLFTINNHSKAQAWLTQNTAGSGGEVDVFFRLDYGDVVFTSDGYCDMYDYAPDGVYRPGYTDPTGVHRYYTQPRFKVGWNTDGTPKTKYRITSTGISTDHIITVHTVNTQPTGPVGAACNQGKTYDIYLYDINVDRSGLPNPLGDGSSGFGLSYGSLTDMQNHLAFNHASSSFNNGVNKHHCGATLFAGDNTVNVNLILCGPPNDGQTYTEFGGFVPTSNSITFKGEPGTHAVIEYDAFPTGAGSWGGTQGSGKLNISQHPASQPVTLTVVKDGTHNAGAGIGSLLAGAVVANGHIEFNSGTVNVSIGGPSGTGGQIYGGYGAAIGSGACGPAGDITINGGTITATSVATTAAIGAGGGYGSPGGSVTGTIAINGGTVTTYSQGNQTTDLMGVGIGAGGSNYQEAGSVGDALNDTGGKILITGGTVNVWKLDKATNSYVPGNIGGGHANVGTLDASHSSFGSSNGGDARIEIHGGTVNAGFIGGGGTYTNQTGYSGGVARVTIGDNAYSGATINVTGGIGGGDSKESSGGDVIITVNKGSLTTGTICGGTCLNSGDLGKATVTITGGTIQGQFLLSGDNSSSSDHCSFTMTGGTIDNSNLGAIGATEYARLKDNGGAIYMEDPYGEVSISGGVIKNCSGSTLGGAIYMTDGHLSLSGTGKIQNCSATQSGGAAYLVGGLMTMDGGVIENNYAALSGGGIYISATGRLVLKGNALVTGNHVPSGRLGGGIYLAGAVEVGSASKAPSTITIQDNYADAAGATITDLNRNNIYLPNPIVNADHKDVVTVIEYGLTINSRIGFSVPSDNVPVVYCAPSSMSQSYLENFIEGGSMSNVFFEDSWNYNKIHSNTSPYDPNYIYLSADTWVSYVKNQPESGFTTDASGNVTISSKDGLAWLISKVNGFNGTTATNYSGKRITLTADIDMSDHAWVPIGMNSTPFKGEFDGGGHVIKGIDCSYISGTTGEGLGMFGVADDATIHDVSLSNELLLVRSQASGTFSMGAVVNESIGNTNIYNCIANVEMTSFMANTIMGGLIGQFTSGTLHSSIATAKMTGYTMGGLAGTNAGNIYNSFANSKFTYSGSGTEYVGGLVATNTGHIENCYAREQAGSSHGSNFGYLVGDNTSGIIKYSYTPSATYTVAGKEGTQTDLGNFTATVANAYDYKEHDNQVAATNDYVPTLANKQLVKTLNNWVKQDATHKATYAQWFRPTTQTINGDYPLLRLPAFNAVAATNGDATLDYGDINEHLTNYKAADQAICLYGSRENVNTNVDIGTNASLYIDQDAVITQTGDIQAYVGVTLDNSAGSNGANPSFGGSDNIDWHFFSSVLADAPIGLEYEDNKPYEAYHYPSWQAHFTNANGYFPLNLHDYYADWDLYAYYEPDYHWINLKRNSASHWHEDYPGINIPYNNDTEFVPGKGYMVALKEEGYLQAYGTLNTNTGVGSDSLSVSVTCTSSIGWTTREGHNLLGNPYQSYLDFEAFVRKNESLWNEGRDPFYIIIDEDKKDYVLYTVRQSPNPKQASRFLHPHQGFMIDSDVKGWARFDNGMRTTSTTTTGATPVTWDGDFRGGEDAPCYPLVNLMATDANGNRDIATVELGRPDKGGALKQDAMHSGKGSLWCRYEDEDYALVFTQPGLEYANIRFAADEDAEFTMTWSTHNGEFSYLHLIDNMTGADIDCLTASEYRFSARESDYNSRFRLVFDYTGIDDHEVPDPVEGPATFAYYANGEIHLTGTPDARARLQIIDMTGRTIVSRDAARHVSTEGLAAGVYVLRLTDRNGTRIQKIVWE